MNSTNQKNPADELKAFLELAAINYLDGPVNLNGHPLKPEKAFAAPLFGYASGSDPIWENFKKAIDQDYWLPLTAFQKSFPASLASAEELSVVVIILPQTTITISDQSRAQGFPSERWIRSRFLHDRIVFGLCRHLENILASRGIETVTPDLLAGFGAKQSANFQITSDWSHRHAAFAAGLGTFGLCDGLITAVGKAHRLASLITHQVFEPTPRTYSGPYDYCLYHNGGRCLKCVPRCPVKAISPEGHDKIKCSDFLKLTTIPKIRQLWPDLDGAYGCGLCQSAVPCQSKIPRHPKIKTSQKAL
ncbi:MAG: hypothetical protein LBV23_09285 [Deltaproteobacteria bacterium]|nr:hypothetical protein [Deltaproteobacteria bacterium]